MKTRTPKWLLVLSTVSLLSVSPLAMAQLSPVNDHFLVAENASTLESIQPTPVVKKVVNNDPIIQDINPGQTEIDLPKSDFAKSLEANEPDFSAKVREEEKASYQEIETIKITSIPTKAPEDLPTKKISNLKASEDSLPEKIKRQAQFIKDIHGVEVKIGDLTEVSLEDLKVLNNKLADQLDKLAKKDKTPLVGTSPNDPVIDAHNAANAEVSTDDLIQQVLELDAQIIGNTSPMTKENLIAHYTNEMLIEKIAELKKLVDAQKSVTIVVEEEEEPVVAEEEEKEEKKQVTSEEDKEKIAKLEKEKEELEESLSDVQDDLDDIKAYVCGSEQFKNDPYAVFHQMQMQMNHMNQFNQRMLMLNQLQFTIDHSTDWMYQTHLYNRGFTMASPYSNPYGNPFLGQNEMSLLDSHSMEYKSTGNTYFMPTYNMSSPFGAITPHDPAAIMNDMTMNPYGNQNAFDFNGSFVNGTYTPANASWISG